MDWSETTVQKDGDEAKFERISDEELIKAIEERANKLGIKINLSYDFGGGWSDDARGIANKEGLFDHFWLAQGAASPTLTGNAC